MPNSITVARPYAKAVFEYALEANELGRWSELLHHLADLSLNEEITCFIENPITTKEQRCELLTAFLTPQSNANELTVLEALLTLLATNNRLRLLPDIHLLFETLRAEQEKVLAAKVVSFSEPSDAQKQQLMSALSRRLKRQVTLDVTIDKSLLGGAMIQAGDLVIDGSVRGKLVKLGTELLAV